MATLSVIMDFHSTVCFRCHHAYSLCNLFTIVSRSLKHNRAIFPDCDVNRRHFLELLHYWWIETTCDFIRGIFHGVTVIFSRYYFYGNRRSFYVLLAPQEYSANLDVKAQNTKALPGARCGPTLHEFGSTMSVMLTSNCVLHVVFNPVFLITLPYRMQPKSNEFLKEAKQASHWRKSVLLLLLVWKPISKHFLTVLYWNHTIRMISGKNQLLMMLITWGSLVIYQIEEPQNPF